MRIQPHYKFTVVTDPELPRQIAVLVQMESDVPGALVYGIKGNNRRVRLSKLVEDDDLNISECMITAPVHAGWLVDSQLSYLIHGRAGMSGLLSYEVTHHYFNDDGLTGWDNREEVRTALYERGRQAAIDCTTSGELKSHVLEMATPYQFMNVAWCRSRPWIMNVWACGSGKTLGAIMSALSEPGPVLVVAPAKARHVWWSQVQEYTNVKPFRIRPVSERRKKDATLEEYMDECRQENKRPFVIIGAESLADNMAAARSVEPTTLILDEIHTHGSRKRWTAIQEADGSVSFERRKTAASHRANSKVSRETRAVAVMDISRLPSLQRRIGLTATPLDDGRPRRLWSQLDLLSPGGFSHSYSRFALRYCDARPGQYGGLDDSGSSRLTELKDRCSYMVHEVPYSESHAALPDTRVQVVYLSNSQLNRAERWSDDQTFGQAIKGIAKQAKSEGASAKERVVEARLAEACSKKRRYVTDEVLEGLKGGGKVVVFTARRRETELWAHAVRREVTRGDEAQGKVPVWVAHGGIPESERDAMVDSFRESTGPCCLIATGQSVGTGVDGMQTADLAIFAMLPWKPGDFVQWKGRFDRLGGSPTLLKVIVAEGTYDTRVVDILVDKFGPIESFLKADELDGLGEKLRGTEDKGSILDSIITKLGDN
jgi:superfamily II DNA or RNA helicase